jgi:hypothetical protein
MVVFFDLEIAAEDNDIHTVLRQPTKLRNNTVGSMHS